MLGETCEKQAFIAVGNGKRLQSQTSHDTAMETKFFVGGSLSSSAGTSSIGQATNAGKEHECTPGRGDLFHPGPYRCRGFRCCCSFLGLPAAVGFGPCRYPCKSQPPKGDRRDTKNTGIFISGPTEERPSTFHGVCATIPPLRRALHAILR